MDPATPDAPFCAPGIFIIEASSCLPSLRVCLIDPDRTSAHSHAGQRRHVRMQACSVMIYICSDLVHNKAWKRRTSWRMADASSLSISSSKCSSGTSSSAAEASPLVDAAAASASGCWTAAENVGASLPPAACPFAEASADVSACPASSERYMYFVQLTAPRLHPRQPP